MKGYRKAAEQENVHAQNNLGGMYEGYLAFFFDHSGEESGR